MNDIANSVILLGVKGGPAIRPGSSMPTSTLVRLEGRNILVDAGLGATAGIVRAGLPLNDIDAVLITHLHSDHYLELGPLLHTAWTAGLSHPIPVFGPEDLSTYWQGFLDSMDYDIATRTEDEGRPDFYSLFPIGPLDPGTALDIDGITVTAMLNHHPPIEESYALRFETATNSVVLSGDTAPIEEMIEFSDSVDLLVHEAMLTEGVQAIVDRIGYDDDRLLQHILRSHTSAADAGRIAAAAGVGALALNHLIPDNEPGITEDHWRAAVTPYFRGTLHIGRDGMVIPLGQG